MKTRTIPSRCHLSFALVACWGVFSGSARADLTFTNLNLTPTSFSVDVSGTMPAIVPSEDANIFYFVNPDLNENPGLNLGDFLDASSINFTGSSSLDVVRTGGRMYGDYFLTIFSAALAPGQSLDGTLSGTWNSNALDPTKVSSLNIFWGVADSLGPVNTGTMAGSNIPVNGAAVPEASSLLMLSLAGLLALRRRR